MRSTKAEQARDWGGPVQTVEEAFVREALPPRKIDGHKGDFGKLLIVGGAEGYTGAPYLTAAAAVRSGCGLVSLGVPAAIWAVEAVKCTSAMPFPLPGSARTLTEEMLSASAGMSSESEASGSAAHAKALTLDALPEILERLENCDVLALGPGLGRAVETRRLVLELLQETRRPVVLDADGINALAGAVSVLDARRDRVTILTPHDVEFARIAGVLPDPSRMPERGKAAREFAAAHGCIVVLKGHRTVTASPTGNVLINSTGNSGLAKGGSGDVLTGLIASLLCQGATPIRAAAAGVWIHGRAGDLCAEMLTPYAMTPEDVINALPEVFLELVLNS